MEHVGRAGLLFLLVTGAVVISGQAITQLDIDHIANHLDVRYNVVTNLRITPNDAIQLLHSGMGPPPPMFQAEIQITNKGPTTMMDKANWEIYFCHIFMIEPGFFDIASGQFTHGGLILQESRVKISFVKGCLFRISASNTFGALAVNETRKITFTAQYWSVAKTDKMPNYYAAAPGLEPRIIKSTEGESLSFVGPHDNELKWKRVVPDDGYNPPSPIQRYLMNNDTIDNKTLAKIVIPTPLEMKVVTNKTVTFDPTWAVYSREPELQEVVNFLIEKRPTLRKATKMVSKNGIILKTGPVGPSKNPEAYSLKVVPGDHKIAITGKTDVGVFYGVQTLLSLLENGNVLSDITITDEPRFGFRGLHVDVARNFQSAKQIQKLLRVMAMYKLNKLHLHLSDDEAWRLEIPGLEELTEVGAKQCHDLSESTCLLPQLGTPPDSSATGAKFYTVHDYQAILKTAKKLHIEVIPEFDFPGRARAAIIAMEARFRKYQTTDPKKAMQYRLRDPFDNSIYMSLTTFFKDGALNPCMVSTYNFTDKVLSEVLNMHKSIQSLKTFHFGGDEAPMGVWINSTVCQSMFPNSTVPALSLKKYFSEAMALLIHRKNISAATWEDGVIVPINTPLNRTGFKGPMLVNAWNNIWELGFANRANRLANAGYQVILSSATHLFFDHPSEPDPEERGYYWGPRYTDSRKVFRFLPFDIYANADVTRFGGLLNKQMLCIQERAPCDPLHAPENIIGMQAQLWSEVIRTGEQLESQAFPRVISFAERAWHKGPWEDNLESPNALPLLQEDWITFSNAVGYKELARLDKMGVKYRVPPPGSLFDNGLITNTEFPGLPVEFSTDGKIWKPMSEAITIQTWPIQLRTTSTDGSRASRIISFSPEQQMPKVVG